MLNNDLNYTIDIIDRRDYIHFDGNDKKFHIYQSHDGILSKIGYLFNKYINFMNDYREIQLKGKFVLVHAKDLKEIKSISVRVPSDENIVDLPSGRISISVPSDENSVNVHSDEISTDVHSDGILDSYQSIPICLQNIFGQKEQFATWPLYDERTMPDVNNRGLSSSIMQGKDEAGNPYIIIAVQGKLLNAEIINKLDDEYVRKYYELECLSYILLGPANPSKNLKEWKHHTLSTAMVYPYIFEHSNKIEPLVRKAVRFPDDYLLTNESGSLIKGEEEGLERLRNLVKGDIIEDTNGVSWELRKPKQLPKST